MKGTARGRAGPEREGGKGGGAPLDGTAARANSKRFWLRLDGKGRDPIYNNNAFVNEIMNDIYLKKTQWFKPSRK